jgi:hypothetical protein
MHYRDKVVGVFVRFSCAASQENLLTVSYGTSQHQAYKVSKQMRNGNRFCC